MSEIAKLSRDQRCSLTTQRAAINNTNTTGTIILLLSNQLTIAITVSLQSFYCISSNQCSVVAATQTSEHIMLTTAPTITLLRLRTRRSDTVTTGQRRSVACNRTIEIADSSLVVCHDWGWAVYSNYSSYLRSKTFRLHFRARVFKTLLSISIYCRVDLDVFVFCDMLYA